MASDRFYNLKPKKKQLLIDSILTSVQTKDIHSLSVTDIAEEAEISRGTFYTYFDDKEDAIYSMCYSKMENFIYRFKQIIMSNNGDFFKSVEMGYENLVELFSKDKYFNAVKNVFQVADFNSITNYLKNIISDFNNIFKWIYENTDLKKLGVKNEAETKAITELMFSLYGSTISRLVCDIDLANLKKDFIYKLKLIKKGVENND